MQTLPPFARYDISAQGGFPEGCFKQETIGCFLDNIADIWPDWSSQGVQELLNYLNTKGVKSEHDVENVDEDELGTLIGPTAAKRVLQFFRALGLKDEEKRCARKDKSTSSNPYPQGDTGARKKSVKPRGYRDSVALFKGLVILLGDNGGMRNWVIHSTDHLADVRAHFFDVRLHRRETGQEGSTDISVLIFLLEHRRPASILNIFKSSIYLLAWVRNRRGGMGFFRCRFGGGGLLIEDSAA
ncbi:hypothetical protein HPB48_012857 [Haemaphysalis longicornis]|uniref:Uncharacterized protein n=1 Tax=Haemaphysalis longicornis TaxID=44386 RepID=A0A9J6GVG5_HAELO|nr:hypothetical protein HPB48_012857 [Haemaphysalis longicornis]